MRRKCRIFRQTCLTNGERTFIVSGWERFEKGIEEEEYIRHPVREDSSLAERLSGKEWMEGRPGAGTVREQNALSAVHVARVKGVK